MGKLRSMRRNLNEEKVQYAQEVQRQRHEVAKKVVEERIKKDVEFAKDVLKAVGKNLPKELKEAAEETIRQSLLVDKWEKTGILEALKTNVETPNMGVIVESQSKELV